MEEGRRWGDQENIGTRMAVAENDLRNLNLDLATMNSKLDLLVARLSGRPSWAVSIILTMLSASNVGLLVALLERAK